MKRTWALALTGCAIAMTAAAAHADISVGAGFENFEWKESTSPTVKESGLRWVLDLTWSQTNQPGASAQVNVKTYTGNVDYDGATLGTNTPISGETHYRGVQGEVRAIYRTTNAFDFVLAGGWDHWRRDLTASQEEGWDVLYARAGVAYNQTVRTGVLAAAGIKFPVYAREDGHLTDIGFTSNPRLRPRGDWSFYGTLGYRVSPGWDVMAYYDSYRFKKSNTVVVSDGTTLFEVFQPKSRQDTVGLKVQHNF
jgi:hypothetical protein